MSERTGNNKLSKEKNININCKSCGELIKPCEDIHAYKCTKCGLYTDGDGNMTKLPWKNPPLRTVTVDGYELFNCVMNTISDHVVYQKPIEYILDTLQIIATYKIKHFNSIGYTAWIGNGIGKGKTRGSEIFAMLSYRGMFCSKPSHAAVRTAIDDMATVVVDQAENLFFDGSVNLKYAKRTPVYDYFCSGYSRGIDHVQISTNDKSTYDVSNTFGAKAYNMQDINLIDDAIKSRTFFHNMIYGIPKKKDIDLEQVEAVREMLQGFHYKKTPKIDRKTFLRGRIAQMIDPLIFTVKMLEMGHENESRLIDQLLEFAIETEYEKCDDLCDSKYGKIISALYSSQGILDPNNKSWVTPKVVAKELETQYGEKLDYAEVGNIMKNMGIKKLKRTSQGWVYDMSHQDSMEAIKKLEAQHSPPDINTKIRDICRKYCVQIKPNTKPIKMLVMLKKVEELLEMKESEGISENINIDESYLPPDEEPPLTTIEQIEKESIQELVEDILPPNEPKPDYLKVDEEIKKGD